MTWKEYRKSLKIVLNLSVYNKMGGDMLKGEGFW